MATKVTMTLDEKRKLFTDACRVVAHLSNVISTTHEQISTVADAFDEFMVDATLVSVDHFMQALGDVMNNHDLNDDDADSWTDPIYERMNQWAGRV